MPPRQKKEGKGELMVSIEKYTRTRDQVIISLTTLRAGLEHVQTGLERLLEAYMSHTNSVLAGEGEDFDRLQLPPNIAAVTNAAVEATASVANGINQVASASNLVVDGAAADGKTKKRKREKKEKDPNAPKKPLTAAFLFAQSARPIIRADLENSLGPGAALEKNAVNLEVNKRWNDLPEEEKENWKASYRRSMEAYKVELAEYLAKAGGKIADIHIDEDMSEDGDVEGDVEMRTIDSEVSSDDDDEAPVTKAPSPVAKTPRANKRQKTAQTPAVNGAASATAASASTPIPLPSTRGAAAASAPTEAPATIKKETKKKGKAVPATSAPVVATPAADEKEASPEEASKTTIKKPKSSRSTRAVESEIDKENAATPTQEKEKKKRERSKRKSEVAST